MVIGPVRAQVTGVDVDGAAGIARGPQADEILPDDLDVRFHDAVHLVVQMGVLEREPVVGKRQRHAPAARIERQDVLDEPEGTLLELVHRAFLRGAIDVQNQAV